MTRNLLPLCIVVFGMSVPVSGMRVDSARSTVFKGSVARPNVPFLTPTDATSQMLQTFQLVQRANAGEVLAQHELGLRHLFGRGAEADTLRAAYWIIRAATQNYPPARFNLGILQIEGIGLDWNPFEAYRSFMFCAERGMKEAQYQVGIMLTNDLVVKQDLSKAREWISLAADSSFAPARTILARIDQHLGSSQAADSIARIFDPVYEGSIENTAADSVQLGSAIRELNVFLRNTLGLEQVPSAVSLRDSARLAAIAAIGANGVPEALVLVGRASELGTVVKRDWVEAASYYVRAARLDSYRGVKLLWDLISQADFFKTLKKRVDDGDHRAFYVWALLKSLGFDGRLYDHEMFITDNQAFSLLERAAHNEGNVFALEELGVLRYSGRWTAKDQDKAIAEWRTAMLGGNGNAEARLAIVAVRKTGLADDGEIAATLQRLTRKGSLLASVGLAYCFEEGRGVQKNLGSAARLYRTAAQRGSQDAIHALIRLHDNIRPAEEQFQVED